MRRLTELTAGVFVATSRRYTTTSTVVIDEHGAAIVIDPCWDPDELNDLAADVESLHPVTITGITTMSIAHVEVAISSFSATPTLPLGSRIPALHPERHAANPAPTGSNNLFKVVLFITFA